jgi:hypothetical protein
MKQDLKVCDDGLLIQVLCFWTSSIVLPLSTRKNVLYIFKKHNTFTIWNGTLNEKDKQNTDEKS